MGGNRKMLSVAIVGSGPAGYYTAEALEKNSEAVRVDILDRLPTPFGLIRGGVAPDHQSIKGVARRYEKTALTERVRFLGNVAVGRDVTIAELKELYDAVVIATGAPGDRKLGIPGEDLPGVIGSAAFVGWYNSHPDHAGLRPRLDIPSVAVIGNGNVAIDVVRVLAKTEAEMNVSDIADYAAGEIHKAPLSDLWMFGRRGPLQASFTPKELGELGALERCVPVVRPGQLPGDGLESIPEKEQPVKRKILGHLEAFAENRPGGKPVTLHMEFFAAPAKVLGSGRVEGLRLERTEVSPDGKMKPTGETFDIECGMVIPCIGYRSEPIEGVPYDDRKGRFRNEEGFIEPGLYAVGWARRGPTGTIGTNRPDGLEVAQKILDDVPYGAKSGRDGLEQLLEKRGVRYVRFSDWQKIDEAEIRAAESGHPRRKFHSINDMLKVLER